MINDPECLVVRLTQDIDMTTPSGLQYGLNIVREFDGPIALWASIPCTGGSPWQYVNEKQYYNNRNIKSLKKDQGTSLPVQKTVLERS